MSRSASRLQKSLEAERVTRAPARGDWKAGGRARARAPRPVALPAAAAASSWEGQTLHRRNPARLRLRPQMPAAVASSASHSSRCSLLKCTSPTLSSRLPTSCAIWFVARAERTAACRVRSGFTNFMKAALEAGKAHLLIGGG